MKDFVHLHLHTEYSLLDGACRISGLAHQLKQTGQTAVAVTNHGVMYGAVEFYNEMKKNGIKPIIGCEVYVAARSRFDRVHSIDSENEHLVLLCKNEEGYKNLIRLVSLGFTEGFYSKPRIDFELLKEYHEGLIALSACLSGALPKRLLGGSFDEALEEAQKYDRLFGRGNYYIEIQNHGLAEQLDVLPKLVRISEMTGIPLVATNDVHYLTREDARTQRVLTCIKTNTSINDENPLEFSSDEFYLKSSEEMYEVFSAYPQALENTVKIAEMCNLDFEFGKNKLPEFKIPGVDDNVTYFRDCCFKGLYDKYGQNPDESIVERLEYELSIIEKMGYVDYYLVVSDFVSFARSQGIAVGPGRGSGAGSLAAYCIGITGVDPIKYNLLFERFLNPERVSMPDFDIDFCFVRRQEVIDYVVKKYGSDRVAQIITFGTMAARAAIRDVGRVLEIPYSRVDEIAKMVPRELHTTIDRALEKSPDLKNEYDNDPEIKELIDLSRRIEGMPRHASVHASGVVITKDPVWSYVPLAKSDETVVTQFTMNDIAKLGLLKFDILGLRTLTVIADTVDNISGIGMDDIPIDDKETFRLFAKGHTEGVFQFESAGMKSMLMQLKPESVEDLTAAVSLYRPGPMDYIPTYIKNRRNPSGITYKTPLLKPIMDVTYGCLVYQEQVMQVFRDLAGYSYGRSDIVRRAMAKKKHDELENERNNFIFGNPDMGDGTSCDGAVKRGVDKNTAHELFEDMMSFADYAYNKAHAASYAIIAYRTAWLKCHHKREFMAALLTSVIDNTPKITRYIAECSKLGIPVLSPDVNTGYKEFTVNESGIVYGLLGVKNIGVNMIDAIISERELNGRYTSFYDFCRRVYGKEFNKRAMESLIKCGALDSLGANRRQMLMSFNEVIDLIESEKRGNIEGQIGLFGGDASLSVDDSFALPSVDEFQLEQLLEMEKETVGIYISGHPLKKYSDISFKLRTDRISDLLEADEEVSALKDNSPVNIIAVIDKIRLKSTKNNQSMAYVTVEDLYGTIEVIVFPKTLSGYSHILKEGTVVHISGYLSLREEQDPQIICRNISTIEQIQQNASFSDTTDVNTAPAESAATHPRSKYYGLHLLLDDEESDLTKRIMAIISIFEGDFPVYIKYRSSGKRFLLPRTMWTSVNDIMLKEIVRLLGNECVQILK